MTAANATPELIPKTATATAMANSKLLLAAVNDKRRCLRIVRPDLFSQIERNQEHDHKIDQQRDRDADNINRQLNDIVAL